VCPTPTAEARERELRLAAWLTFGTLASSGRERLLAALESLLDSIEARLHPLGIDLLDESPEQVARREAPWLLPVWTAARAIARRCFVAGDRSLAVLVHNPGTPLPSTLTSFDPFGATDAGAELRLARFLCGPISNAVKIELSPLAETKLRERCATPKSTIALVIDSALQSVTLSRVADGHRQRMQALRKRLSRRPRPKCNACESFADVIDALSSRLPSAPALDWLELGDTQALIVPRLSAVAQRHTYLTELNDLEIPVVAHNE